MLLDENTLAKLRREFNLNLYEVRIWVSLLSRGVSSAGELSDIANVPRSRTYDILESLEKKGFVLMKLGKPVKYMAIPPSEVVERIKSNLKAQTEKKIKRIEEIKSSNLLKTLEDLYNKGVEYINSSDLTTAIRGRKNIYEQMNSIISKAQNSIIITTSETGIVKKYEAVKNALDEASKRGVKIKIITKISDKNKGIIDKLSKIAEIHNVPELNSRVLIADNNELIFMPKNDEDVHENYDMGIWLKSSSLGASFQKLLEEKLTH